MLDVKCPSCERDLQLPEDALGRECQCPSCHRVFRPNGPRNDFLDPMDVPDIRMHPDDARDDLEILAERQRFLRQIEQDDSEGIDESTRWNASKRAAKYGLAAGFGVGVLTLFIPSKQPIDAPFAGLGFVAIIGALIAFVFVHVGHGLGDKQPPWIRKAVIVCFAGSLIWGMRMFWKAESRLQPNDVAAVAMASAGIAFLFWIALLALSGVWRLINNRRKTS